MHLLEIYLTSFLYLIQHVRITENVDVKISSVYVHSIGIEKKYELALVLRNLLS